MRHNDVRSNASRAVRTAAVKTAAAALLTAALLSCATTQAVEDEHTIMLLPSWWPAGVSVTLPNRSPAIGDTVVGSAFAFIADGRKKAPTAKVWAWRVPCTRRVP